MKKTKRLWSWALAGALAISNLSVVAAPFTSIIAQAADEIPYSAVKITNAETSIGETEDLQITVEGANAEQTLYQQFVEYRIVNITGAANDASTEYAAFLAAPTTTAKDTDFEAKADALDTEVKANYVIDKNTGVLSTKGATVGDVVTVGAIVRGAKDNAAVCLSATKTFTVTSAAQTAWLDIGTNKASATTVDDKTNGISIAVDPTGAVTPTTPLDLTMYDRADKKANLTKYDLVSAGHTDPKTDAPDNISGTAQFTVSYTLSDITNVSFTGADSKKTSVSVTGAKGVGDKTPSLQLTDTGKELKSNAAATLTIDATLAAGGRSWKKTQKVAVNIIAPTNFDINGTYKTTSDGVTYGSEEALASEIKLPAGVGATGQASLIYIPSSGIDNANLSATSTSAAGATTNIIIKYLVNGKFVALDGNEKITAAGSLQTAKVYDGSSPLNSATATGNYYNVVFSAPAGNVDASETFQITTFGTSTKTGEVGNYYQNVTEVKVSVDNATLEVKGIPNEMYVGEEFDLNTVTAIYGGKAFDLKNITKWTSTVPTIIDVDNKSGIITAKGAGSAKLFVDEAKLDGNNTTSAGGNVTTAESLGFPVVEITVSNKLDVTLESTEVEVGETLDLSKATIKSGDTIIDASAVDWVIKDVTPKDGVYTNDYASLKDTTLTGIAEGSVEVRAYLGTVSYGAVNITVKDSKKEKTAAIEAAIIAADKAASDPTAENIQAAKDAVAAAEALGATADELKAATDKIAEAEAAKAKNDAIAAANTAADAAVAAPSDSTIAAAKAAVEAAKAAGATEADLKAATDKIAQAEAAKAAADEAAKKAAETAADGSAAKTPAPVGTELKDASGKATGFKVTDANPAAPEVEFVGPADKDAKSVTVPDTQKDLSGNEYKVTSIAPKAFKDSKAKTITIGKNIKKIPSDAFSDSKLKNAKIKGTKLTKKMAKSFKKLKKGGKITCSGSNKKKNKKYLSALKNVKNGNTKLK